MLTANVFVNIPVKSIAKAYTYRVPEELAFLSAGWRVLAPDHRGAGWSSVPGGGYDKAQLAADLLEVLAALGVHHADVVGHDWGSAVSWWLAGHYPDRESSIPDAQRTRSSRSRM